jgi:hypothetical protein
MNASNMLMLVTVIALASLATGCGAQAGFGESDFSLLHWSGKRISVGAAAGQPASIRASHNPAYSDRAETASYTTKEMRLGTPDVFPDTYPNRKSIFQPQHVSMQPRRANITLGE